MGKMLSHLEKAGTGGRIRDHSPQALTAKEDQVKLRVGGDSHQGHTGKAPATKLDFPGRPENSARPRPQDLAEPSRSFSGLPTHLRRGDAGARHPAAQRQRETGLRAVQQFGRQKITDRLAQ